MTDIVERMNKWRDERGFPTPGEILDEAAAEILRLRAEVERHRMTEEERGVLHDAADAFDYDNRAMKIADYLDRTAPRAEG